MHDTVLIPYGRLILCGPGRTGKSSLLRSFLQQAYEEGCDSTTGVELEKIFCRIVRHGGNFVWESSRDTYAQQLELTHKAVGHAIQKRSSNQVHDRSPAALESNSSASISIPVSATASGSPTLVSTANNGIGYLEKSQPRQLALSTATTVSPLPSPSGSLSPTSQSSNNSRVINSAREKVQRFITDLISGKGRTTIIEDLMDLVYLDVWDFAGQRVFAAIQHMVLACCRCAYAVVFDASKKFSDIAKPTFGAYGKEHSLDNAQKQTNFDILETWLNTIQEVLGDNDADVPVFVVGTHIDKIAWNKREAKQAELSDYIWQNAEGKAYANNLDKVVFVDNTKSGSAHEDDVVVELRQTIIRQLQTQFRVAIPIRWLPFTVAVRHITKEFERPWLSVEELHAIAVATESISDNNGQDDFLKMLRFHHDLGHLLHFSSNARLQNYVITDVQWLLKVVSLLFCPEPKDKQPKKFRPQYDMLAKEGVLLESLAEYRWSQPGKKTQHGEMIAKYTATPEQRQLIFDVCEHFALFYDTQKSVPIPGRSDGQVTRKFFVPSLVSRVVELQLEVRKGRQTAAIYLFSGRDKFFPQTLFWCSIVRLMQRYSPAIDPILHHSSARLLCLDHFWLVLHYFQHGLRLAVEIPLNPVAEPEAVDSKVASLCHELLPYLEAQLAELKEFSLKHVPIGRAVQCYCSYNEKACSKHGKKSCPELDCHHYAPLVEGLRPRCTQGGKPEVGIGDVRQFWPCFHGDMVSEKYELVIFLYRYLC